MDKFAVIKGLSLSMFALLATAPLSAQNTPSASDSAPNATALTSVQGANDQNTNAQNTNSGASSTGGSFFTPPQRSSNGTVSADQALRSTVVPEPGMFALFGTAAVLTVVGLRRRRRQG